MSPDQAVYIVGDGDTLGSWDASKAQRMKRKPMPSRSGSLVSVWELALELVTGVAVNYKYLIIGRDRRVKWESVKAEFRTVVPSGFETVVVDGAFGRDMDEVWVDEGWLNSENQVRIELGYYDEVNGAYTPAITGPLMESTLNVDTLSSSSSSDNASTLSSESKSEPGPMSLHFFDGNSYLSREVIPLPLRQKWTEVVFHLADLEKLKITVEVYDRRVIDPTTRYAGESQTATDTERLARTCISRAQLKEMRGFCSVPLFNSHLDHVGTLNFKYLVVTPFKHSLNNLASIWKSLSRASKPIGKAVGHRGCGSTRTTFISENTILSFLTAADYGADYVEFDVQITNEGVPVINHDFHLPVLTSDGATLNVPLSSLNKKQFKSLRTTSTSPTVAHLSTVFAKMPRLKRSKSMTLLPNGKVKNNKDDTTSSPFGASSDDSSLSSGHGMRLLDQSTDSVENLLLKNLSFESLDLNLDNLVISPSLEHMVQAKTVSGTQPLMAASTSALGHAPLTKSIINPHDRFATLDETLRIVPAEVGFVIEIKYPAERFQRSSKMRYAERNEYADAVLKSVFDAMQNPQLATRKIMLISFDPDLCVLLSQKQPRFPVFLLLCLNHGIPIGDGDDEIEGYDPRCQTLETAAMFARNVRIQGLICDASSVLSDPTRYVSTTHDASLLLMTYGAENMDEEKRAIQKAAGVDSLIMDNMVHINRESRQRKQVSSLFLADYGRQNFKLAPGLAVSTSSSQSSLPPLQ